MNANKINEKVGNQELKRFKAAQKYIQKIEKSNRINLAGTWEEDNKQCFTNGFTAFILKNKIEGLPTIPNNPITLHNILNNVNSDQEIDVNISDIKASIKIQHATNGRNSLCHYDLGISLYNAQYILDCYNILGGNIVFKQSKDNETAPAILESENGIAILMPIRKAEARCA